MNELKEVILVLEKGDQLEERYRNHSLGAFQTENYLMPPTGRKYVRFMDALLGFYGVGLHDAPDSEEEALQEFLKVSPSRTKIT